MKTIRLQGIGECPAIETGKLKIGDVIMWNYGSLSEVMDIKPASKTGKTVELTLKILEDGTTWKRKRKTNSFVVVVEQVNGKWKYVQR